ncbi:retinoic acid receptor RXR-alpha-B-like [Haliotis rufescens]|uniref:retinoic acid receptor RXR-alpha-B-like n=1 Tax=Haliotis rufescens TaxID=6454 RepID=UPI001EB06358|nr:retinoic acid receptor RXR-alpha-B-like [Haliotis rufescens]
MEMGSHADTSLNSAGNILIIMQDENGCETTIDSGSLTTESLITSQALHHFHSNTIETQTSSHTSLSSSKPMEVVSMETVAGNEVEIHPNSNFPGDMAYTSCLVCGDRASGYHYSVFSCEGCKGFFKRTVQKSLTYCCKEGGSCEINKYTRNSCQACRFNKCLQMGMKREAVREDRAPGGKHRLKRQRMDESSPLVMSDGLIGYPQVPKKEFTDPLVDSLVDAGPDTVPKYEGGLSSGISVNELMQCGYSELKYIIEWAKKVPGFSNLDMEDQMALLKSSFMELNVLRLAYRSMGLDNTIKFADGLLVPSEIAQTMGWGKELINATLEFAVRLKEVHLDHSEFCILNALVLTYPDAVGIQNKDSVITLQIEILEAMLRYMKFHYPTDTRRHGKMLLRLPALRTVSAKAAERFLSLTLDGSIQLNELVLEMIN